MNTAAKKGHAKLMRDFLVESDCYLDPQAYILRPEIAFEIGNEIIKTQDPFIRTLNTAKLTIEILQRAVKNKELVLEERELNWLDILESQIEEIPEEEEAFIAEMKKEVDTAKYNPAEYGI